MDSHLREALADSMGVHHNSLVLPVLVPYVLAPSSLPSLPRAFPHASRLGRGSSWPGSYQSVYLDICIQASWADQTLIYTRPLYINAPHALFVVFARSKLDYEDSLDRIFSIVIRRQ